MDLRKVTCSECKSHLHYMENMSVKKNGVTMHFGDRFCMGGKKPRKFGRGDPKIYVPTWCPKRKVPSELRIYGFKSVEQWMLHHDMCEQLGTDISPSAFRYAVAYELHAFGRTDRTGKQRAKALPSPVGTIYAVIADAVRPLPKRRPNSLSPHDRNVQERPRPDRRTETSAPRSERPCDLGSEKPAQPPCENSLRLFPNRSRFSHLPGLNPFRRTLDFSGRTPSENTDRRSSPTQTGNLTDGPSERYDPVP